MKGIRRLVAAALAISALGLPVRAAPATVHFNVFTNTGLRLTDILWTGRRFLFIDNTTNRVLSAPPSGTPLRPFTKMPRQIEETRCVVSPGAHGFPANMLYCHSPTNRIYRISPDGKRVSVFAILPHVPRSDGALAFDMVGKFGFNLVAATGRSGAAKPAGGVVFTIDPSGRVRRIGGYSGPGGADEIAVAPSSFGSAAGQVLIPVDAGPTGRLAAMDEAGHTRTVVQLSDGPNPIVVVSPGQTPAAGAARPGLYVTDTFSHLVYFASASQLRRFAGEVLLGSELHGIFSAIKPQGPGFTAQTLPTDLPSKSYNLEAAVYISR